MTKPNFLFLGPDKTGSSWMFNLLRSHPECFVPRAKDIYFFNKYYHLGWDWYLSHFKNTGSFKAVGELSHDYFGSEESANLIQEYLPDCKLICCLRNPVERSWSQYLYLLRSGEGFEDFFETLRKFPGILKNSQYLGNLHYYQYFMEKDQLKVLIFEDLKSDPYNFCNEILKFLQLELREDLPIKEKVREAAKAKNKHISRFMKEGANFTRKLGFPNLVGSVKNSNFVNILYSKYEAEQKPKMPSDVEQYLVEKLHPQISLLEDYLDYNLEHWR